MEKSINFSHNWNGKLDLTSFTTIRLHKPGQFNIGDPVTCTIGKAAASRRKYCVGKIEGLHILKIWQLTDEQALTDIGQKREYLIAVLQKMYASKVVDWNSQDLVIIKIKTLGRYQKAQLAAF